MSADANIARLEVTLHEVRPAVERRIEVPVALGLDRLHATLQAALGWTDSHLWEFRAGDLGWGFPDPGWSEGPRDAKKATLLAVLQETGAKTLTYLYDFGDGWEHTIKVECIGGPEPGIVYPRLLEAKGRCPPEDVGGPWGYAEFLEAIADPNHDRHDEFTEWYDADFDASAVDVATIGRHLANLAKRWSRAKPKRSRKAA